MKEKTAALIDLGSNSIRLAIYKIDSNGQFEEINKDKTAARLIGYLDSKGNLSSEGIDLIITTLKRFQTVIKTYEKPEVIGFATAVIREAANRSEVLDLIKKKTSFTIELLSEYEEAYYGYLGVIDSLSIDHGVTIDIGGGSTEITLFENRKLKEVHSFPFGAVSLNTKFTFMDPFSSKQLKELHLYLLSQFNQLQWLLDVRCPVIAIGGTARNLGRVYQAKHNTHECKMGHAEIEGILKDISSLPIQDRGKIKGLSKKRKDIIIPGIQVFLTLMESVQATYFEFSERSVRDGIVIEKVLGVKNDS
ncbi:Ppx/GppA family phosphatase [Jeotgalibacillus proteolyticus]|uniref:Exopolyphosphatase n=1 Tax=Jeotgalibacillus proteolyticus TaxID=2082395 RepID=A0A2S5G7D0_9BACL|nr:Ppx/GppA family phosphatase [Jeotgalibacillus proteolyticus]PPA68844.1 exopolyphosphatase [Jeotgalibacillus proteolyticus]